MIYWILGGVGAVVTGLVAFLFRRKRAPDQPTISPLEAESRKARLAKDASQARTKVFRQVSADLEEIRKKFGDGK